MAQAQCLSGAGGILLAINVLKEFYKPLESINNQIWHSEPTWPNHSQMTKLQGLTPKSYRYYNLEKRQFSFDSMIEDLKQIP